MRPMTDDDLPSVIDVQQLGAVLALAHIFPQDEYPFPREVILTRWRDEIADPRIEACVAVDDEGAIVGFAATRGPELLHFGTAVTTWGSGAARELHDAVVLPLVGRGDRPTLYVFSENQRARRFYEKLRWRATGRTKPGDFPPHPLLVEYALDPRT